MKHKAKTIKELEREIDSLKVWEYFAPYLLDNCEGEIITEENLHRWLASSEKKRKVQKERHKVIEITKEEALNRKLVEIEKYIRKCPTCMWFSEDGTCDSCSFGFPYATDNNGKKPSEIQECNIYRVKK